MLFNTNFSQTRTYMFLTLPYIKPASSIAINPSTYSIKRTDTMDIILEEETQNIPKISIRDINGRNMLNKDISNKKMFFNLQKTECFSCNYH